MTGDEIFGRCMGICMVTGHNAAFEKEKGVCLIWEDAMVFFIGVGA